MIIVVEPEDLVCDQLAAARSLCAHGHPLDAEQRYQTILREAESQFGAYSWMVASVHCELAAFYASQEKHCSAKKHTELAFEIMRW
ncbi:MAG TPA: hypothetical protein V6D22_02800 [Candidatus Obscuribacterales bacterium]